jgi:hypothetical protein
MLVIDDIIMIELIYGYDMVMNDLKELYTGEKEK